MASPFLKEKKLSFQELLSLEEKTGERYEMMDGYLIEAMAGAKRNHTVITSKLSAKLVNHLDAQQSPCFPSQSDLKVKIGDDTVYYPDIVVDCGEETTYADKPKIIIEVLSDSTQKKDKVAKFYHYITLETLEEYVLVQQDFMEVMVYRKKDNWKNPSVYRDNDVVVLESIQLSIAIEEIYQRAVLRMM